MKDKPDYLGIALFLGCAVAFLGYQNWSLTGEVKSITTEKEKIELKLNTSYEMIDKLRGFNK